MSLGDYLRFLRAMKGGPTPWEIQAATGVSANVYRHLEQRYRELGDDETVAKLAAFFDVPVDDLQQRKAKYRKVLSAVLLEAQETRKPLRLVMRNGHEFTGTVEWWDLGSALLRLPDGDEVVIQRHMVDDWTLEGFVA